MLVCDTGGATGGLAAYAGVQSARSLVEVAARVAARTAAAGGAFAADPTTRPAEWRAARDRDRPAARRRRERRRGRGAAGHGAQRQRHALTVVDCGRCSAGATGSRCCAPPRTSPGCSPPPGGARARRARPRRALPRTRPGRELIVARRDPREPLARPEAVQAARRGRARAAGADAPGPSDPRGQPGRALARRRSACRRSSERCGDERAANRLARRDGARRVPAGRGARRRARRAPRLGGRGAPAARLPVRRHLPARPDTALSILATNARLLGALLLAVVLVRSPWLAAPKAARGLAAVTVLLGPGHPARPHRRAQHVRRRGRARRLRRAHGRRDAAARPASSSPPSRSPSRSTCAPAGGPLAAGEVLAVAAASLTGLAVAAVLETFVVL